MRNELTWRWVTRIGSLVAVTSINAWLLAAPPVVKTVPANPNNPTQPHVTYDGRQITLKGTCDAAGVGGAYEWDFGDGSAPATGIVGNQYIIEAKHVYSGVVGTVWTAHLTVKNPSTSESATTDYLVKMQTKQLVPTERDIAIDEGLWFLHKSQRRYTSGGNDYGDWLDTSTDGGYTTSGAYSVTAYNLCVFELAGHQAQVVGPGGVLQPGRPEDPYTETVRRGLNSAFALLSSGPLTTWTGNANEYNPDTGLYDKSHDGNGNGLEAWVAQTYPWYQGGQFMDAIVASATPTAVAQTGPVAGQTYKDIVQDMLDAYAGAQYDYYGRGGWRYNYNEAPDNSVCQWAAIGIIPAERNWGCVVPTWLKPLNIGWLRYSQASDGQFGYSSAGYYPWGTYATTPSGMVQMAMDGIGRGDPSGMWEKTETWIRDHFADDTGSYASSMKSYYYGMLSFVKAMRLHAPGGVSQPIDLLRSSTPGVMPIDWYAAEKANGDPTDGVARTLVNDQYGTGQWYGNDASGDQYRFDTAFAILMLLHPTEQLPVAVATVSPNKGLTGQTIKFDGSKSYHLGAPALSIVAWEWDFHDGTTASGVTATHSWAALGDYPVTLTVTDDNVPPRQAQATVVAHITTPPVPPVADAGRTYVFCPAAQPWFLDGRGSFAPDAGQHEPGCVGCPDKVLVKYEWDLGDGVWQDLGPTPDVTAYFAAKGPGAYTVQLRVTDNSAVSFPTFGADMTSDPDSAVVFVKALTDPDCSCITDLTVKPKGKALELTWTDYGAGGGYNVYRSDVAGGPYGLIGNTPAGVSVYDDSGVVSGNTYYYIVRGVEVSGFETCQSNEASGTATCGPPIASCPAAGGNRGYYMLIGASVCYPLDELKIWVQDEDSAFVAGPYAPGTIIRLLRVRTGAAPSVGPGFGPAAVTINIIGRSAMVIAEDPSGQKSAPALCRSR